MHVFSIVRKAYFAISVLFRCFLTSSLPSLLHAYMVYARPLLEYGSVVWSPFLDHRSSLGCLGSLDRLEAVQRSFTRRLFKRCSLPDMAYKDRLELLGIESLELRCLKFDLCTLFKIVKGLVCGVPPLPVCFLSYARPLV